MKKYKKLFVFMLALPLVLLAFGCPEDRPGNEPDLNVPVTGGPYTITVENGTIEADADEDGKYPYNTLITFTAEDRSETHEIFISWTLEGELISDQPQFSIKAVGDGHYLGNFIPDPGYIPPILEPGDPGFAARTDLYRFYDDFSTGDTANNNMLDSTKWGYDEASGFGSDSTPPYFHRDNVRIVDCDEIPGNRKAVITLKKQNMHNRNYTSGKFWSRAGSTLHGPSGGPGFASTYGKIEARIRMFNKLIDAGYAEDTDNLKGLWPAFWMMPADSVYGRWPISGEIDIMNVRGSQYRQMYPSLFRRAESATQNGQPWVTLTPSRSPTGSGLLASYDGEDYLYADIKNTIPGGSNAGDWHVYCVEWDYDGERIEFRYYVDDVLAYTIKESQWEAYSNDGGFNGELPKPKPFDQDFYLIFNLQLDSKPNDAIFAEGAPPVEYEIDWVVWREIMPRDGEPGGIQKPIYPEQ